MIRRGIAYSAVPGQEATLLDLYIPDGVPHPPLVLWIHGGGFVGGDRVGLPPTLSAGSVFGALTASGLACASIDYRLAPAARYPEPEDDVRAALAFLRERGSRYGYDAARIGAWGESSGGMLALLAGLTAPGVSAVVAWYPVTDILAFPASDEQEDVEVALLGRSPKSVPDIAMQASPITYVTSLAPPCLFVHGDSDGAVPLSQSTRMHQQLLSVGADSTLRVVRGADHCFAGYDDIDGLVRESVDFLAARLSK